MLSYFSQNWLLLVMVTLISSITPFLVNLSRKWWKDSWLYSLNKTLIINKGNPVIIEAFQCAFSLVVFASIIFFVGEIIHLLANHLPWNSTILWALSPIPVMLFLRWLEHRPSHKDIEGLVGILSPSLKGVMESKADESSCIYFATHVDSYEKRKPILDEEEIKTIRDEKIIPYYDKLKQRIEEEAKKGTIHDSLFRFEGTHVCDFMTEQAYSLDSLMKHIRKVNDKVAIDPSINFIGDKVGICGYRMEDGMLSLEIYLTDHFTFKVFKEIFLNEQFKGIFQLYIRRVNRASGLEKELLVESLKFLFSSFGVDVVVHGLMADGKPGMLIALRSGNIERLRESKIHVPVNESFSKTDEEESLNTFSLYNCVKRGIEEELGIQQHLIADTSIQFQDFAMVCDEGEIGIACYVDLSDLMPLEQARMYTGQDKFLEMKDLLAIPLPPFFVNPDKYLTYFYKNTRFDFFCSNWESFTPVLYQRFILRNKQLSDFLVLLICTVTTMLFVFAMSFPLGKLSVILNETLISIVLAAVVNLSVLFFLKAKLRLSICRRHFIKPLVPQFGGDATVQQSIGPSIDKGALENINLGFVFLERPLTDLRLEDLCLVRPPYCKTRKEGAKNHTEVPISFYKVALKEGTENQDNRLGFLSVPCSYENGCLKVWLNVLFEERKVFFRFTKRIEPDISELVRVTEEDDFRYCLHNYFHLSEEEIGRYEIFHFCKRCFEDDYKLQDFFKYKGDYFWTMRPSACHVNGETVSIESKDFSIFDHCVKGLKHNQEYCLSGKADVVLPALVSFLSHKRNRSKVSSLDIYALQMTLIRLGPDSKGLVLAQKG